MRAKEGIKLASQAEVQGGESTGTHSTPFITGGVKAMEA